MKSIAAFLSLLASSQLVYALTVNTPVSITACQPTRIQWADGTPPYFVTVVPGGQAGAAPLKTFDSTTDNSVLWQVDDVPAGTSITISVKDGSGDQAFTSPVTIGASAGGSCSGGSSGGGSSPAAASGSSAASGTTAAAAGSSAAAPSAANASSAGSAAGAAPSAAGSATRPAAAAASTSQGNANTDNSPTGASRAASSPTASPESSASRLIGNSFGLAGLVGVVGAALF
ncbi:hypothetical protein BDV98DRAFT_602448 [Pterulicium gracile]|uniref:Ser-Thr-rich glycosyl-phosphatidyl-inositol-anchored membrane family-domain-containing protein n=1 Tax=Pterulicium gracile TaxID=1884261 RepID=A0A5C3QRG2_9AGAR|nr:hypothetical protein BDV98DRAFT_602448 [Pterula gracilis]